MKISRQNYIRGLHFDIIAQKRAKKRAKKGPKKGKKGPKTGVFLRVNLVRIGKTRVKQRKKSISSAKIGLLRR
jgi:hypothetical protein